jgi:hypothetical protein
MGGARDFDEDGPPNETLEKTNGFRPGFVERAGEEQGRHVDIAEAGRPS